MTYVLTDDDIAVGDVVSVALEKMWGWYLAFGILSIIFGFFVISYRHASVYAIIYLASGFFIAVGLFEIVGAVRIREMLWPHLVFGVIWIGAGVVGFVWPHITIYIPHVAIGWAFLVLGIFDIIESTRHHHLPYWWLYLIRGIIAVALGFLCIRHPGAPLTALVVLIGILAIVFGAVEIVGAFWARHATKNWDAYERCAETGGVAGATRQFLPWRRAGPARTRGGRRSRRPERPGDRVAVDHGGAAGARAGGAGPGAWGRGHRQRRVTSWRSYGVTHRCPTRPPSWPSG